MNRLLLLVTVLAVLLPGGCPPVSGDPNAPLPDPSSGTMLASIDLPGGPTAIAIDSRRDRALLATGARMREIDLETLTLQPTTSGPGTFHALDDEDDRFAIISPDTGRVVNFRGYPASLLSTPGIGTPTGMVYNPDNHSLYVIDIAPLGRAALLLEFDLETASFTQIGEPGLQGGLATVFSLARHPATGDLYTVDVEDRLWRIDPQNATAEPVGGFIGFTNVQGLSFAPDAALFGIHSVNPPELVSFDLSTGTAVSVGALPLSYAFGSLAFKPDGTLWAVDLSRDAMVQIDPASGALLREFDPLPVSRPNYVNMLFLGIDALTWVPDDSGAGFVDNIRSIESIATSPSGRSYASAGNAVTGFREDLMFGQGPQTRDGLLDFDVLRFNPSNRRLYTRDGIEATVYELDPNTWEFTNTWQLHENFGAFDSFDSTEMAVDSQTGRVFVRDPVALYVVNPTSGEVAEVPFKDPVPSGVALDATRRRLYLNLQEGTGESLVVLDLDSFAELGRRALGVQTFELLVDEQRGRLLANARTQVPAFDTTVFVLDADLNLLDASIRLAEDSTFTGTTEAQLALDSARNRLLVTRAGERNRVDVYQLPD